MNGLSGKSNNMPMSLDDLSVLRAVARDGGFRAAAKRVGLSASRVSDIVRRCEDRLGVRLFERSTRHVQPTDLLVSLLREAEAPLDDLQDLIAGIADTEDAPKGTLRIGAPVAAGPLFLTELAAKFAIRYPSVSIDLRYDDAVVDPITEGLDLVVRSSALLQQDHHALPIGPQVELCLVAAPQYLSRHSAPKAVTQVAEHNGICFRLRTESRLAPWVFKTENGGGVITVMPRIRAIAESLPDVIGLAREGLGLAMVYAHAVERDLANGTLVEVLSGQPATQPRFSLAYLSRRHQPAKVRKFIEMTRERSWTAGKSIPAIEGPVG